MSTDRFRKLSRCLALAGHGNIAAGSCGSLANLSPRIALSQAGYAMQIASYVWLLAGIAGHLALWVALFNRNHALGLPRRIIQVTEKIHISAALGIPAYWGYRLVAKGCPADPVAALFSDRMFEAAYFDVSCLVLVYVTAF